MNNRHLFLPACVIVAALLIGPLAGCSKEDAATYVASARGYIAKGDYKAAIIEAKNALQKDPDNGDARLLLARSLLESGDPVGAEVEVRKAMTLHVPDDQTYPVLAWVLVGRGDYKKLAVEVGDRKMEDAHSRADVQAALASAAVAQGDLGKAKQLIDAALADDPANVRVLMIETDIAAKQGDAKAARHYIDTALQAAPTNLALLVMKSNLELVEGKIDAARAELGKALAAHPDSVVARYALFEVAVRGGKLDDAKEQVANLKKSAPKDLRTHYAAAVLALSENDRARAKEEVQYVVAAAPNYVAALLLSATIDTQSGNFGAAEQALRRVLAQSPDNPTARRMLAVAYLNSNRPGLALEALAPAMRQESVDPGLLRMAGEAYLASGNPTKAADVYERANALDKANVRSQVRLAQVRLATGDTARGMGALESIAESNQNDVSAELALYSEFMRKRQFDKALAQVDAVEKKRPSSPMLATLRGAAYMGKRNLALARASFEKALEVPATASEAAHNLAVIDLQEGKAQAARERYQRLLAKDPKNDNLLFELAELLTVTGAPMSEVKVALERAIAVNPSSVRSRLALIGHEGRTGGPKAAVASAQAAVAAIPDNPQLMEALGATLLAAGEPNRSLETFRKLVQMQPQNAYALLRLAEAQMALKDYSGAIASERKALEIKPDDPRVLSALTKTYIVSGQVDAALSEAKRLQKDHPQSATGYALQGDLLAASKKWNEAALAYKAALERQPLPGLVVLQYVALQAGGKSAEAKSFASKWNAEHPNDTTLRLTLAGESLRRNDTAAALRGYEQVLAIDPENFVALNNTASILAQKGDSKAVEYAEHAYRLAPFNPAVLDTLGWTLAQMNDPKRGTELLRMAARLAPAQAEIRLHLAKALIAVGDKTSARQELAELSKLDKTSPVRAEAEKLQSTL